ncbi:hypothetical protein C8J56DRAFT_1065082 [Mycena floridula]|nr:hypothetical protein C8J56DRAFT_1065082 [Mycena floridula]
MGPVTIAKLWDREEMAVGMSMMVLFNITTEANVANGSKSVINDIILDSREPEPVADKFGRVHLKFPPALVIFRPENTSITNKFQDKYSDTPLLKLGQLPITPMEMGFSIQDGKETIAVTRRQFAMTAAYAYTHEKAQGQTLGTVLVDLAPHPGGELTPFHVYVALLRSKGRSTIRIL